MECLKERRAQVGREMLCAYQRTHTLSTTLGQFRARPCVADALRDVCDQIRNTAAKLATNRLGLFLVRMHGSPYTLWRRPEFFLDTRELALNEELGLSRATIMMALEKLTSLTVSNRHLRHETSLLRRVDLVAGQNRYQQGSHGEPWRKPILWKFTSGFRIVLDRLHRRLRKFAKETKCKAVSRSFSQSKSFSEIGYDKTTLRVKARYMADLAAKGLARLRSNLCSSKPTPVQRSAPQPLPEGMLPITAEGARARARDRWGKPSTSDGPRTTS